MPVQTHAQNARNGKVIALNPPPVKEKKKLKNASDFLIIFFTMLLVVIGLIMVYDSSYYVAQQTSEFEYDGAYFLKKQLVGAAAGIAAMTVCAMLDYRQWRRFVLPLLIGALILMVMVWVPGIGQNINGSNRWVKIPGLPSIQSSEPAKFALIVYLAHLFTVRQKQMDQFMRTLLPALCVTGVFAIMLYEQPNLSMLITYIVVMGLMMWMAGARWFHLSMLVVCGVAAVLIAMQFLPHVADRLTGFADPEADPLDTGYQILQSLYAIAGGGWAGVGFGNSRQKFLYLPYRETDFIFSIYAEEFGFLGCLALLALYWLLIWRCVLVTIRCPERFGRLLAGGITAMLAVQVIINVAVVTGSMPPTGLPLPFISAGGSSLTIFLAEIGILLNISRSSGTHKRC